jgi:nuclear pore complex protein Nup205
VPSLQLIDGMLATLGTKHATLANQVFFTAGYCFLLSEYSNHCFQALDFLSSHSATIVILLKNETDYVPLALLEEIHLIVTLCGSILPSVPKSELVRLLCFFLQQH